MAVHNGRIRNRGEREGRSRGGEREGSVEGGEDGMTEKERGVIRVERCMLFAFVRPTV